MSSIISVAQAQQRNFNTVNQTVTVEGKGALAGKKVMLFLAPLAFQQRKMKGDIVSDDYKELRESYQAIFKAAQEAGAKSVAVPCFSTGQGALDRKKSAHIAVEEAVKFSANNSDMQIRFVPYHEDKESIHAYFTEIEEMILKQSTDLEHVSIHPGLVQYDSSEVIVCPIREKYNVDSSGVTAQAIVNLASSSSSKRTFPGVKPPQKEQKFSVGKGALVVQKGDITQNDAEIIVNAANPGLRAGGGVCRSIFKAADPELLKLECEAALVKADKSTVDVGDAILTGAGMLEATNGNKGVIHAVGPDMQTGISRSEAREQLKSAYRNALVLAKDSGAKSIAFPSISTGIYGYPLHEASALAAQTITEFLEDDPDLELEIRLVAFEDRDYDAYQTFFSSATKEKNEVTDPLLEDAARVTDPRFFHRNIGFATVDAKGPLKAKQLMFYAAPISYDIENEGVKLQDSYSTIFAEAMQVREDRIREGKMEDNEALSVAIPCFSVGKGGVDHENAAKAAISAFNAFIREPENRGKLEIRIVPYYNGDKEQDAKSIKAYSDLYEKNQFSRISDGIVIAPGLLEHQDADLLIVPIREGYKLADSGPIAKSVVSAVKEGKLTEPKGTHSVLDNTDIEVKEIPRGREPKAFDLHEEL